MRKSLAIPPEIFDHLVLDSESSTGLRWTNPTLSQVRPFSEAGFKRFHRKTGRPEAIIVGFKKKEYKVHRVIWTFLNGEIPDGIVVDHIDGNPFNNSISNLKIKTQPDNMLNSRKRSNNTSGETGVYLTLDKRTDKHRESWVAYWLDINGKRKSKSFSCDLYGSQEAFNLAVKQRKLAIQNLIKQGKNYTERHGT